MKSKFYFTFLRGGLLIVGLLCFSSLYSQFDLYGAQTKIKYRDNPDAGVDGMAMDYYVFASPNFTSYTYSANNVCGEYAYSSNQIHLNDTSLYPTKNNYIENTPIFSSSTYINGVNSIDLLLIDRHLKNITNFTSAWEYLSADATADNVVDSADLDEIRDLVLGSSSTLTRSKWSWVPKDVSLSISDPWTDVDLINIDGYYGQNYGTTQDILSDYNVVVFKCTKTGDINGSNSYLCTGANYFNKNQATNSRSSQSILAQNVINTGDEVVLNYLIKFEEHPFAMQWSTYIDSDKFDVIAVQSDELPDLKYYHRKSDGRLTMISYAGNGLNSVGADLSSNVLIRLRAKRKIENLEIINNSQEDIFIAANKNCDEQSFGIDIVSQEIIPNGIRLINVDFTNEVIQYSSQMDTDAVLVWYDLYGRKIGENKIMLQKGNHFLSFKLDNSVAGSKIASLIAGKTISSLTLFD